MAETTLKLRTQADLKALIEYTAALKKAREELQALGKAQADAGAAGSGAPGAGPSGQAGTGTPAPHPPPAAPAGPTGFGAGFREAGGQIPVYDRARDWARETKATAAEQYRQGGARQVAGYGLGAMMRAAPAAAGRAGGFISNAASTAIGVGLGSSITGFFLQSGQKFMELSKIMEHLQQRFRESEESVTSFGSALGFTIAQSAMLTEQLGAQTNAVSGVQFQRYAGFARFAGMDPGQAMQTLGGIQQLGGRYALGAGGAIQQQSLDEPDLLGLLGGASRVGMGQGRLGEYLSNIRQSMDRQMRASGSASVNVARGLEAMTAQVFERPTSVLNPETGEMETRMLTSELGRGQLGMGFQEDFQQVITGQRNPAMRTFMMRAMGYGSAGSGLSFREAEERLERGITDENNIEDMFNMFERRGYSQEQKYMALRSAGFTAIQAGSLADTLGTAEGLDRFKRDQSTHVSAGLDDAVGDMSDEEKALLRDGGLAALGASKAGLGSWREVQMENLQMKVGAAVAEGMFDATKAIESTATAFSNLLDVDFGKLFTELTGAVADAAEAFEKVTRGVSLPEIVGESTPMKLLDEAAEAYGRGNTGEAAFNAAAGLYSVTPHGLAIRATNWLLGDDSQGGGGQ